MEVSHPTAHTLDRALDAAGAASFELDVTTRRLTWSAGTSALLGAMPGTYGGWLAQLDDTGRRRLRDAVRGALRHESVLDVVVTWHGGHGEPRDVRVRCAVEPQFDGRVMGLVMAPVPVDADERGAGFVSPGRRSPTAVVTSAHAAPSRNPEFFDVAAVIANAGLDAYRTARVRDLDVVVDVPGEIPRLALGRPTRLRDALDRLLTDAIERTEAGWIELRARHDAATGRLELTVEDTEATGLDASGAWGMRVSMEVPCPAANGRAYALLGHGRHALLLCERRRTAEVLAARMDEIGLRTTSRSDPVAATRAFASMEHLDVVVLEPTLEGVDAAELAACWRHARPEIPVVYARPPAHSSHGEALVACLTYPWTAESVASALGPLLGTARAPLTHRLA